MQGSGDIARWTGAIPRQTQFKPGPSHATSASHLRNAQHTVRPAGLQAGGNGGGAPGGLGMRLGGIGGMAGVRGGPRAAVGERRTLLIESGKERAETLMQGGDFG